MFTVTVYIRRMYSHACAEAIHMGENTCSTAIVRCAHAQTAPKLRGSKVRRTATYIASQNALTRRRVVRAASAHRGRCGSGVGRTVLAAGIIVWRLERQRFSSPGGYKGAMETNSVCLPTQMKCLVCQAKGTVASCFQRSERTQ